MTDDLHLDAAALDLSPEETSVASGEVPCAYRCGRAGTGKTFSVIAEAKADPAWGMVTAVTGIAAVNIGAVTINSILKYFDTASMRDSFLRGSLTRILHDIARAHRWLVVDEVSMMDGDQLDILYRAVAEANRYTDVPRPMGILLVGDFAQLPPVRARFAFEASCWGQFAANTTRLTKVWRQQDGPFLDALNAARSGDGAGAAALLDTAGIVWHTARDVDFEGTTIVPKNTMVNRHNQTVLDRLPGKSFLVCSHRWGAQRSEWGENRQTHEWGIPDMLELKIGAYVMCLANRGDFSVVNGDCGHVVDYDWKNRAVNVRLVRTGKIEYISPIVRGVEHAEEPEGWSPHAERIPAGDDDGSYLPHAHYRGRVRRYVTGQIEYLPLRLAWSSTVHKSQGLSLDNVQCDYRDAFFGQPGMLYVALSRARTLEGLRLVGQREVFVQRCKIDVRVREWL